METLLIIGTACFMVGVLTGIMTTFLILKFETKK
jgi:hypothetical protein